MLPYLPPLYPDELLYSLIARTHLHLGSTSSKRTIEMFFGSRTVRASVALPTHLGALSCRLPPERTLSPASLLRDFTLYPYLTAFQPQDVRDEVAAALIRGNSDWINVRLGLAASRVRPSDALRFCPSCKTMMMRDQGELYWRRAHQLPGVLICPDHGIPLADSRTVPGLAGQHDFIAAEEANCPEVNRPPVWAEDQTCLDILFKVAQASRAILEHPPAARSLAAWGEYYHSCLRALGFAKGRNRIDQEHLRLAVRHMFEPVAPFLPVDAEGQWLEAMTRKHRKSFHPLQHVLMNLLMKVGYAGEGSGQHQVSVTKPPGPRPPPRRDWITMDREMARIAEAKARFLRTLSPPVRVCLAAIRRQLGEPGWLNHRLGKLPLTAEVLTQAKESTEQFQLRRVAWAKTELARRDLPLRAWRIRRLVGIRPPTKADVEAAITGAASGDKPTC